MRINNVNLSQQIINNRNHNMNKLQTSFARLSSAKRINVASDDISGFNKTTFLKMKVRGLNQTALNLKDELSYVQLKESALGEMTSVGQRMRELKVASENGSLNATDLEHINQEFTQLKNNINDIYVNTEFNTLKVLKGSFDGIDSDLEISIEQIVDPSKLIEAYSITDFDNLIGSLSSERGVQGAKALVIEAYTNLIKNTASNTLSTISNQLDADMAKETMQLSREQLLSDVSLALLSHVHQKQQHTLELLR